MKFKKPEQEKELSERSEFLQELAREFGEKSLELGIEPVVTRVTEAVSGESGVHPQGRAVDFRDEYAGKFLYSPIARAALLAHFEKKYARTDGKPTLYWHSFNGMPHHFHLQVAYDLSKYVKSEEN